MHVSFKLFETIMFAIHVRNAYEIRVVCHLHEVCRSMKTLSVDWKKLCTLVDTWRDSNAKVPIYRRIPLDGFEASVFCLETNSRIAPFKPHPAHQKQTSCMPSNARLLFSGNPFSAEQFMPRLVKP